MTHRNLPVKMVRTVTVTGSLIGVHDGFYGSTQSVRVAYDGAERTIDCFDSKHGAEVGVKMSKSSHDGCPDQGTVIVVLGLWQWLTLIQ